MSCEYCGDMASAADALHQEVLAMSERIAELEAERDELKSKLVTVTAQLDYHKAKGTGIPKVDELVIPREVAKQLADANNSSALDSAARRVLRAVFVALEEQDG